MMLDARHVTYSVDLGPIIAWALPSLLAGLAYIRGRRNTKKLDQVHAEVRSPNGSKTGESVDDMRHDVAAIAVGLGEVQAHVAEIQTEQKRVGVELAALAAPSKEVTP